MNSANSRFLGRVDLWTGQRKLSVVSALQHLQKRLAASAVAQQHLEMHICHSIYLGITNIYVICK